MKKKFLYLLAAVCMTGVFTACSDDDDKLPGDNLETKTYTSSEGLTLEVDGTPTLGKAVTLTPVGNGKATLTLSGEQLNLGVIIGGAMSVEDQPAAGLAIPTAGVIPGSPKVEIPVELQGSESDCHFSGSYETEYCTFAYAGKVTRDAMDVKIANVKLKNTSLCGIDWTVPTYTPDEWGDISGSLPLVLNWESSKGLDLMGMPMPMSFILNMVMVLPMIEDPFKDDEMTNLVTLLPAVLKNVKFGEDGNITAKYVDTESDAFPTLASPSGLAQYVVTAEGKMLLFLNPQAIIATAVKNSSKVLKGRGADLTMLIEGLMNQLLPMLVNGIPLEYGPYAPSSDMAGTTDDKCTSFYLGTETLLPLVKVLKPVLEDEQIINMIIGAMGDENAPLDPDTEAMIRGLIASIPAVIDGTTKIEVGINLMK